jgi:hypothetical protein
MMGHGPGAMGSMMGEAMPTAHRMAGMSAEVAKGAAVTGAAVAATRTSGGFMSTLSKHPILVFGLGLAAGYLIHKYRKEIIATATNVTEQGKDFVLQQRENLEDLVAECHERADDAG